MGRPIWDIVFPVQGVILCQGRDQKAQRSSKPLFVPIFSPTSLAEPRSAALAPSVNTAGRKLIDVGPIRDGVSKGIRLTDRVRLPDASVRMQSVGITPLWAKTFKSDTSEDSSWLSRDEETELQALCACSGEAAIAPSRRPENNPEACTGILV